MMVALGLLLQVLIGLVAAAVFWLWGYLVGVKTAHREMARSRSHRAPAAWRGP